MAVIKLEGVTKLFRGRGVRDVTFEVRSGEIVGLIGPNGSGKTTLLRLAAGVIRPGLGKVSGPTRNQVRWVEEDPALYLDRRVIDYLSLFASLTGASLSSARSQLPRWGLEEQATALVRTLSRGQKRRLALARGLLGEPTLLLLDEPWSGLDPQWRRRCEERIFEARDRGAGVIFTGHTEREAAEIADRLVVLWGGRVVVDDTSRRAAKKIQAIRVYEFLIEGSSEGIPIVLGKETPIALDVNRTKGTVRVLEEESREWLTDDAYLASLSLVPVCEAIPLADYLKRQ